MTDQPAGWLTIDEAAALIRVPKRWLYERTRLNAVSHLKLGKYLRFDRDELVLWARQFHRDGRHKLIPAATVRRGYTTRTPRHRAGDPP